MSIYGMSNTTNSPPEPDPCLVVLRGVVLVSLLADVTRATRARLVSELRYKQAVQAAAEEHSQTAIAHAAGVSRQAVSQLLRRSRSH